MADEMNFDADFGVKAIVAEVEKRGGSLSPPTHSSILFKEEESSLDVGFCQGLVEDYQELVSLCQRSTVAAESLKLSEFSGQKVAVNDLIGVSTECVRVRTGSHGSNVENGFVCGVDPNNEGFDSGEESCEKSTNEEKFVDLADKKDFEAPRTHSLLDDFVDVRSGSAYDETKGLLEKESGPGSFLETKKIQLLKELERMLVLGDKPQKENVTGLNKFGELTDAFTTKTQKDEKKIVNKDVLNLVKNEADYTNSCRSSLRIEVVDETALIDSTLVSQNGNRRAMAIISPAEPKERKGMDNTQKEMNVKKKKRPRRKGKESKKIVDSNLKTKCFDKLGGIMIVEGSRKVYSRKDMEALRFTNATEQRKLWKEIYNGFIPSVAKEYDDLASFKNQNPTGLIVDPPQAWVKNVEAPAILREASHAVTNEELASIENEEAKTVSCFDMFSGKDVSQEEGYADPEQECEEDVDSDEDYSSIQRVAFMVNGEPNFESGPPEDGLEYLRRVRWEAAQVPKVKVAKVDRSKFNKEQSAYMPHIPCIPKCPDHLLPLQQWEDAFLQDFSDIRLALSRLETSQAENAGNPPPEIIFLQDFISVAANSDDLHQPCDTSIDHTCDDSENLNRNMKTKERCEEFPMLSTILSMDSIARASTLRKRIRSIEGSSGLTRSDCVWVFALCASVDAPLDADGCAALRSLLRKCAILRAEKTELDEEIIMLNILVTISGRYFGQSEN